MSTFTQHTQAATCTCYGRGYVIDGAGDFAACTCEAGEAWGLQWRPVPAPDLAPALSPRGLRGHRIDRAYLVAVAEGRVRYHASLHAKHLANIATLENRLSDARERADDARFFDEDANAWVEDLRAASVIRGIQDDLDDAWQDLAWSKRRLAVACRDLSAFEFGLSAA